MATHAYLDTTDRTLSIITYRNVTAATVPVPANIISGSDYTKRNWIAQTVSDHGFKLSEYPSGKNDLRPYPYGQYINLNRIPGQSLASSK